MTSILKIENFTKKVKGVTLLDSINLTIDESGVYGIIGRNGSGKSIFFKTLSGLLRPTQGSITLFDINIHQGNLPRDFGALLDIPGFLPQYSGFQNLKFLASIQNKIEVEEIKSVMNFVGLNPESNIPVRKYSLGMKQRLGIAQAIMEHPKFLILDEPMNGLDESGVEDVRNMIKALKEKGVTVLIASHNSEDIRLLCDKVYKMDNGKLSLYEELNH